MITSRISFDESMADEVRHNDRARREAERNIEPPAETLVEAVTREIQAKIEGPGLTFVESPGHGWLEVPGDWIEGLDLIISQCSFYTPDQTTWWLEEDCDMTTFVREVKDQCGIVLTCNHLNTSYKNNVERFWNNWKAIQGGTLQASRR